MVVIPDCGEEPSMVCSVSQDCTVKIWNIERNNETIALNLVRSIKKTLFVYVSSVILLQVGCWLAPVEPSYVIYCKMSDEIWIGDTVGSVYRLKFGSM